MQTSKTALILGLTLAAAACGGIEAERTTATLYDPNTGEAIGVKDLQTRDYVFPGGTINERDIDRRFVSKKVWTEQYAPRIRVAPLGLPSSTVASGSVAKKSQALTLPGVGEKPYPAPCGACWHDEEGGARCTGCCYKTPTGCFCWETCVDVQTSKTIF